MNKLLSFIEARSLALAVVLFSAFCVHAEEVAPPCCGPSFQVTGDFKHYKNPLPATQTPGLDPQIFGEEIFGDNFAASVNGLPPGNYKVDIHLAEIFHHEEGDRLMSVSVGTKVLADNLDIFKAAGGFAKSYTVTGTVEHAADAVGGPLTITFKASKDATFRVTQINPIILTPPANRRRLPMRSSSGSRTCSAPRFS